MARNRTVEAGRASRRLVIAGAGAGLVVAPAIRLGAREARAQDATPAAGPVPGYMAIRRWTLKPGVDYAEFIAKIEAGYVPIVQGVEGFVDYYNGRPVETEHVAVAVFTTADGAAASTVAAKEWAAANVSDYLEPDPVQVLEVEVWLSATPTTAESRTA